MALFVKRHNAGLTQPVYSIGMDKTVLLVGLGNPGKEYDNTRHNIGFACLDAFAQAHEFPGWTAKKDLKGQVTSLALGDTRVILLKPTAYMNNSGEAVQAVQQFYKIPPEQTVIIHDEIDIPFGQIRLRSGGGSAGHNGLKSVIQHGGENTGRVRVGVQNELAAKIDSADFVLASFSKAEQTHLKAITKEVVSVLTEYVFSSQLPTDTRTLDLS